MLGQAAELIHGGALTTAFATAAWVFYRYRRLQAEERMHERELRTAERFAALGAPGVIGFTSTRVLAPPQDEPVLARPGRALVELAGELGRPRRSA
jgi:hypothetical protein